MECAKKVRCNVTTIPNLLTYNQEYPVLSESENGYVVLDEQNEYTSYRKYMFDVVDWEEE